MQMSHVREGQHLYKITVSGNFLKDPTLQPTAERDEGTVVEVTYNTVTIKDNKGKIQTYTPNEINYWWPQKHQALGHTRGRFRYFVKILEKISTRAINDSDYATAQRREIQLKSVIKLRHQLLDELRDLAQQHQRRAKKNKENTDDRN